LTHPSFALCRGHRDLKHAIAEGRRRFARVDALRQWYFSIEAAVRTLSAIEPLIFFLTLFLPLSAKNHRIVSEFDFNVVLINAGQIGTDN